MKKAVSGVGDYTFKYDSLGNIVLEQDNVVGRRTYYLYDENDNLYGFRVNTTDVTNAFPNQLLTVRNQLDAYGNLTAKRVDTDYALNSTYFDYNEDGTVSQVATSTARNRKIAYTYDEESRVSQKVMSFTAPLTESFSYNGDGLISTHTFSATEGTTAYGYTYDENYNITEITKGGVVQQSYVYDDKSQLVRENNRDINKTIVYNYDAGGNITKRTEYPYTTGTVGTATKTVNYTYDTAWKDKLTIYDGQEIEYDAIGNPTSYKGATLEWKGRQLVSYTKGDLAVTYKYDANGLRTQKTVNGVNYNYVYEDDLLVYEQKEGEYELNYRYDDKGMLFTVSRYNYSSGTSNLLYAVNNTRGDVIELRNGAGEVNARYSYDSWGRLISVTNASGTVLGAANFSVQSSIRYRGYVYDTETGLYYLQSRYYDAETGRFLNADDVDYIGYSGEDVSFNAFAYCENNAVCYVDPNGNTWLNKIKNIFTSIISTVSSFFSTNTVTVLSINNDNIWLESSSTMGNDLMKAAKAKGSTVIPITEKNFADCWNSISSKYVIIHSHGDPTALYDDDEIKQKTIFTIRDMHKLKRNKKVKCVIIIACSVAGTAKGNMNNFACCLSKKINKKGVVVGSKVNIGGYANSFEPTREWSYITYPWNIYRNGKYLDGGLPRTITMEIVYDYLVNHNYL